jgi:hypothetical protein
VTLLTLFVNVTVTFFVSSTLGEACCDLLLGVFCAGASFLMPSLIDVVLLLFSVLFVFPLKSPLPNPNKGVSGILNGGFEVDPNNEEPFCKLND